MKKKSTVMVLALVACVLAASGAYAFGGGFAKNFQGNEAMKTAVENHDFEAFIAAASETESGERMAGRLSEEKFEWRVKRFEGAQAVKQAIEDKDYHAWQAAMAVKPMLAGIVSEENFETFVAMHEAKQNGDLETAQALAEELGLPLMKGKGFGHGHQGRGYSKG